MTSTHLFSDKNKTLPGVNIRDSFDAVFEAIASSGDLAQDRAIRAYQHFAEGIARLSAPCVWLPGSHDFKTAMSGTLATANIAK